MTDQLPRFRPGQLVFGRCSGQAYTIISNDRALVSYRDSAGILRWDHRPFYLVRDSRGRQFRLYESALTDARPGSQLQLAPENGGDRG